MTDQNPDPVIVAVGLDPLEAGLAYAAAEAEREGCGLHLVHAVHLVPPGPGMVLVDMTDVEAAGRSSLAAAEERARDLVPDTVPITSKLVLGGVVSSLVHEAGPDARLMVLERRTLSRMERVVTRSISSGVAAHARIPVVSVPSEWPRSGGAETRPVVTVGIDIPDRSEPVLRAAVAAAKARGATLQVVHTWSFPAAYDDIIMSQVEGSAWRTRATADIQVVLDRIGVEADGVPVEIEARHGQPADALIHAGLSADLLVLGRHDPLVPLGSHLGPVARAVLHHAECPVLLLDARPPRTWSLRRKQQVEPATS